MKIVSRRYNDLGFDQQRTIEEFIEEFDKRMCRDVSQCRGSGRQSKYCCYKTASARLREDKKPAAAGSSEKVVEVCRSTCSIDAEGWVSRAEFAIEGVDERGQLESSTALVVTTRADTVHLRADGLQLELPRRVPDELSVPSMMDGLLPQLSPEFRVDKGARCGLQTTYLDECLRITRCTTRSLAGSCAVHLRVPEMQ